MLPRYEYSYFGEPDAWGGRLRLDTTEFNVVRENGNNTQRAGINLEWDRPFTGNLGELYKLIVQTNAAAYTATDLNLQPTYAGIASTETVQAHPTVVSSSIGRSCAMAGPAARRSSSRSSSCWPRRNSGRFLQSKIPNEDSLDLDFTDTNLFAINRFPGIDRAEGGMRANVGMHGNWTLPHGGYVDGLVGQVYREHVDDSLPLLSGLNGHVSDVVARLTVSPSSYFDLTGGPGSARTPATPPSPKWSVRPPDKRRGEPGLPA